MISALFHKNEIARLHTFEHAKRRQSFAHGRLAGKLAVRAHCDDLEPQQIQIENGVFDQPILTSTHPEIHQLGVSISHSDHYAAALVFHRAHPMGIDVDLPSPADIGPVLAGLSRRERNVLEELKLDDRDAAALMWVARESLAKTLTTGLMTPLSVYTPSSITLQDGVFVVFYENFSQYRSLVWHGVKGWLGITLPGETVFLHSPDFNWS
ncbi:4'-phosphopantetheinyl transferase family protein [Thalassospira mesophila]|nr:hypothetical protein [Thalassospira mesophila]